MSARGKQNQDVVTSIGNTCAPSNGCPGCAHPWVGMIETGGPTTFINDSLAARKTDQGPTNCPHGGRFIIIEGSSDVKINGLPAARLGDKAQCIQCGGLGQITKISTDVFTNKK